MKNTQKAFSAATLLAVAGSAFGQVTPGDFTADRVEDYEGTPGGRTFLSSIFGGDVAVIPGTVEHASVDAGDWQDFRTPGGPIQPTSGSRFGVQFGFGDFTLDFTGIGGIDGIKFNASAAGVGDDIIEFFDLDGNSIGSFTEVGGWGPGDGTMEPVSFTSTVAIGSVRLQGRETTFDDIGILQGDVPPRIVVFDNSNDAHLTTAVNNLGLNAEFVGSQGELEAALNSGDFIFALIDEPASTIGATLETAIQNYIDSGNRVHAQYWNLDGSPALQGAFDVAGAADYTAPREIFDNAGHPSWGGAASPVTLDGTDPWADNGDELMPTADGEMVATLDSTSGPGATVAGNENRTLYNGFEYDTKTDAEVIDLLEAQIDWVQDAPPPPPPPGSFVFHFIGQSEGNLGPAADQAGVSIDTVINNDFPALTAALQDPDNGLALIDNPCCFFDGGTPAALQDFIDNGNSVHISFWNLDAEPAIQDALGVASAFDFLAPREVFDNAGHPSWGDATSPVTVDFGAGDPWADNGDEMTPASGADAVATFDSTSGPTATIVANGDRTLVNAFEYDTLTADEVIDLLAAQIAFVAGGDDCPADLDGDGELTLFDFLEFQNLFDAMDPRADFDGDGFFTLFDFLEFQNEFDAGCE